jgi:hypothetical protein
LIGKTKKAALDRFLADNPELEELSAKLATFNAWFGRYCTSSCVFKHVTGK